MGKELSASEIEACAHGAHEVNRAYSKHLGDNSNYPWEVTSEPDKRVARQAVIGIITNDHNAQQSHEAWVSARRADGWTKGAIKSYEKKTHPCLVPFDELPSEFQIKDELFVTAVKSIASAFWRIPT